MLIQNDETVVEEVVVEMKEIEEVELAADAYNNCCKIVQLP